MANVLVVLEQRGGRLKRVSHEALGAAGQLAQALGGEVHAVLMGGADVSADGLGAAGADRVYRVADDRVALYQASTYAATAATAASQSEAAVVLLPASALGRDLGPRLAVQLDCAYAADVTEVSYDGGVVVKRPVYSGKALLTLKATGARVVVSLRPNAFAPATADRPGAVTDMAMTDVGRSTERTVTIKEPDRAALDVAEASIVVSGGRGLKDAAQFKLVEDLAAALGGAVGASRAVVDAGWRPHAEQVGQTGKTVSPNLYVAVGISGAIQHLAGMRTAKVIVAINKDPDAPIFKVADYGIVGDLFEVVPRLTDAVRKLKEN